jgi:hypothetical protein
MKFTPGEVGRLKRENSRRMKSGGLGPSVGLMIR